MDVPKAADEWNDALVDEMEEQLVAYHTFRDLGPSRSYNKLMAAILHPRSRGTYQTWRRKFFWDERTRLYDEGYGEPKAGMLAAIPTRTPGSLSDVSSNLENIMQAVLQTLDAVFELKPDGKRVPKFEINNTRDFQTLVKTLADLVNIQLEIHRAKEREDASENAGALAKAVNEMVKSLTTTQLIDAIKGGEVSAVTREGVEEGIEEADYQDVPGQGVEDG